MSVKTPFAFHVYIVDPMYTLVHLSFLAYDAEYKYRRIASASMSRPSYFYPS
jgi:hypothetical protein